jgi:ELWxxDGT repeat protein
VTTYSKSSIDRRTFFESLEQRQLMAVSEIHDLTIDPNNANGRPAFDFAVSNGVGFFTRWGDGSIGSLWTTDGVTATEVGPGPPDTFRKLFPVQGGVVGLRDGIPSQLWRSDGTAAGTFSLGNVAGVHTTLGTVDPILNLRGHVYINDENFNAGIYESDGNTLVFRGRALGAWGGGAEYSNGIVFNTFVYPDGSGLYTLDNAGVFTKFIDQPTLGGFPDAPFNVEGGIVFLVRKDNDVFTKYSLWRTDGIAANTVPLHATFGDARFVAVVGSDKQRALIQVIDQKGRESLWSTDGTSQGTRVIQERLKGDDVTMIGNTDGHTLFVVREDSSANTGTLWSTDGTPGTTHPLTELDPYPFAGVQFPVPQQGELAMQTAGGVTYFVNTDAAHGWEIWRTDGTRKGTGLAFDLVPGPGSAQPVLDGIVGDRLIFNATLEGHRGLFGLDLIPSPSPIRPPTFSPAPMPFSNMQIFSRPGGEGVSAADLLTSSMSDVMGPEFGQM